MGEPMPSPRYYLGEIELSTLGPDIQKGRTSFRPCSYIFRCLVRSVRPLRTHVAKRQCLACSSALCALTQPLRQGAVSGVRSAANHQGTAPVA